MALSKKQAKQIADLINECICWTICVNADLKAGDNEECQKSMKRHDVAGKKLNAILGQQAINLYYANQQ